MKGKFPENENLEHYFHAVLHLVRMVLEGELSTCLVAAKQPSNTVTNPRQERLAVDTKSVIFLFYPNKTGRLSLEDQMSTLNVFGKRWNPYTPSRTRFSNGLAYNRSKASVNNSQIGFVRFELFEIYLPIYFKKT